MPGVVDADTHIIEHPGMWELFDPALYQRRPVLASTTVDSVYGENNQVWLIDGMAVPKRFGKGSALVAVGGSDRENARTDIAAAVRYVTDPEARVRDMDKRGVDTEVVYPTLLLSYLDVNVALEVAVCQAYNRFLGQAWKTAGDRLRWVVVPPLRDMDASVREIETARDHGAVGVFFRGVEGDRSLAESYFFPVYEAANRLGMAICIHTGAGAPDITKVFDRNFSHNLPHVRSLPLFAFRDLVAHKIPERFPDVRFGLHRGLRLVGPLHPAPSAASERCEAQRRRRRGRLARLGPRLVPRLPALRGRGSRRRPALPAYPHRRRPHHHWLRLRPPGPVPGKRHGGGHAPQGERLFRGGGENPLRQSAPVLRARLSGCGHTNC
ncbi:MAG: amidohydrolase family protein [Deltaproteobacteria bacterium]|nr:amidohydrolase family protein [Deltaproteobacteria bacterium]